MGIQLTNVSFCYGEQRILDNVNLAIEEKEHIGIIGSSGGGKSTLLKIIAGLYQVQTGSCVVQGKSTSEDIRKQVAVVMQNAGIFPLSIKENITCGHEMTEERIWHAIKAAQLEEWVQSLPEGIHTMIGERASTISGGQAQRIAIARAIAKDAPIVLLDEPTSALDEETTQALLEALRELTKGKTVLHVTHRMETLVGYDRIYQLREGTLYAT